MQSKKRKRRARKKNGLWIRRLKTMFLMMLNVILLSFVSVKVGTIAGNLIVDIKNKAFEMSHPLLYMTEEDVIANNQKIIEGMNDGWQGLRHMRLERIEAARLIVQIEAMNLNLSYAPDVEFGSVEPMASAHFDPKTHKIVIRMDRIQTCTVEELIETVCHEMKHAEQYELVKAFRKTDQRYKNLDMYDEARILDEEFTYYVNPAISAQGYRNQYCEQEAKRYSEERLNYYFDVILMGR